MRHRLTIGLAMGGALVLAGAPATADTVIGRWCDQPIPGSPAADAVVTIRLTDAGTSEAARAFMDGSSLIQPLVEESGAVFAVRDSASGDKLRIVQATGNLQFLDNDGFIREATRLENAATDGECQR